MCPVCLLVSVRWCSCWCSVLAVVSEVSVRCVFAVGLSCCVHEAGTGMVDGQLSRNDSARL